jgi:hypothetical protein
MQSNVDIVYPKVHELALNRYLQDPLTPFFIVSDEKIEAFSSILQAESSDDHVLVFGNPSSIKKHPGWPLRNIIASIAYHR